MGVINPENMLAFKSSEFLFAKIKKRLHTFDADNEIDTGDFHKHVAYVVGQCGKAFFKECHAVLPVNEDGIAKLPENFKSLYAAYKCTPVWNKPVKDINEQRPYFYYTSNEECQQCNSGCEINCQGETELTKVVVRTFINGSDAVISDFKNPILLQLSPNVRNLCEEDCMNLFCASPYEISIDVESKTIQTGFKDDCVYMQYYGLPLDEKGLPMIPDQDDIEKAIEYYIYTQLFEELYWNSTKPNIGDALKDVRFQFDTKFLPAARYWARLPSFAKMINSTRRQRSRRKFYYSQYDRTIS